MAKISARRKSLLENPEEFLDLAYGWLEQAKRQWKWLALGLGVVVLVLAAWGINARMAASREAQAVAALARLRPRLASPGPEMAKDLEQVARDYPGTHGGRDALLLRANLLYQLNNYAEAAKAYTALLQGGDPGWDALINESLSYCYEGLGDYQKAAATLKQVEEYASGPLKAEATQRLALVLEQAGDFKEAAVYWKKLVDEPGNPALRSYLKERLAAAEAKVKK